MTDRLDTDVLGELVNRKLRLLAQLRELTVRQPALIQSDDTTTLLRVFAAKQKLLDEIHRHDAALEPFRSQDPEQRRWRSPELRSQCAAAAERCRQLLEEIKAAELQDKSDLAARHTAIARQLDEAHAAATARTAYRQAEPVGGLNLLSER